jgi:hypothetical protein
VSAALVVLAGCGVLQPTPARFRPPLPAAEPMPELRAEDVVARLEAEEFACSFDPPGDIGSSWNCRLGEQDAGDYADVSLTSGESGPIDWVVVNRTIRLAPDTGPDPAVLDTDAAAGVFGLVVALIVPEAHRPSPEELFAGVQRNFPIELGGGWFIGFERNAISRSMSIIYSTAGD